MRRIQMTLEERADLVLAYARVLYVNGQSTDQTLTSTERLGHTLGFRAKIIPRWGELLLRAREGDTRLISGIEADPTGVVMGRVNSTMRAIEDLDAGRLAPAAAKETIRAISQAPPRADLAVHVGGGGGRSCVGSDFWRRAPIGGVSHIRECGSRCHPSPGFSVVEY
jgi:hypothetical protein